MSDDRKPPFDRALYEYLLAVGVQPELARELAEECGDDVEIEVGPREGERTLVELPKKPTGGD